MRKRFAFSLVLLSVNILLFVLLEAGTRFYFATQLGPGVWQYGADRSGNRSAQRGGVVGDRAIDRAKVTDLSRKRDGEPVRADLPTPTANVGVHIPYVEQANANYSKYIPFEKKTTRDSRTGEIVPIRINNHGFRGRDFEIEKPAGTIRVLTLGASSTFGYSNSDGDTYPHFLEQALNQRAGGTTKFEVINLAIPHAISSNILAMFVAEGIALEPDVVTFYEGANDAAIVDRPRFGESFSQKMRAKSLFLEFSGQLVSATLGRPPQIWSDEYADKRSGVFLKNVSALLDTCRQRGIRLILATQQLKSMQVDRPKMRGLSYADEVELVRRNAVPGPSRDQVWLIDGSPANMFLAQRSRFRARMAKLRDPARNMLVHARIMASLREFAATQDVRLVDVIHLLDQRRDLLTSWVHLAAEANRMVAGAFADAILETMAPELDHPEPSAIGFSPKRTEG